MALPPEATILGWCLPNHLKIPKLTTSSKSLETPKLRDETGIT